MAALSAILVTSRCRQALLLVLALSCVAIGSDSASQASPRLPQPPSQRRQLVPPKWQRQPTLAPPRPPTPRPKGCPAIQPGSTDAADAVLSAGPGVLFSDFVWGVKKFKLQDALRRASAGKVLVVPTNAALAERFVALGLYRQLGKIPAPAVQQLRKLVQEGVAFPRASVTAQRGCSEVYITHKLGNLRRIAPVRIGGVSAAASTGIAGASTATLRYSILGQGYNSLTGLPLSVGMSSLDPGITLQPVFVMNSSYVTQMPPTGGGCQSQFSTTVYNSISDMKQQIGASLSLSADFGIASFSANANFNHLSKTSSATQTVTTNSGAKVYLGGFALSGAPGALALDPSFVANMKPLFTAVMGNTTDQYALQSLIDNYGTHYINMVYWGGLASVTSQMTSSQYSSFEQTDVSVSISAQVAMVQVSASVDYSNVQTNEVRSSSQTFGETLIPSAVNLTLANTDGNRGTTYIDCVGWTRALMAANNANGWKAPVHYTISPLTQLFSYKFLWPVEFRPYLTTVQSQLLSYITRCGYLTQFDDWSTNMARNKSYTACPNVDSRCVIGTYRTASGGCKTCYDDGTVVGPYCNTTGAIACTSSRCFCHPVYAPAWKLYKCQPLRGQPLASGGENQYVVAQCPAGLVIDSISSPVYGDMSVTRSDGTKCNSTISYKVVYEMCIGHSQCVVQAANSLFGDPCPNKLKSLSFSWTCNYPQYASAGEGNVAEAICPNCLVVGKVMQPVYGNLSANCNSTNSYTTTINRCYGKNYCGVTANSATFGGDPCNGTPKRLGFHYSCVWPQPTGDLSASGNENTDVTATCPFCQIVTSIKDANYGKLPNCKAGNSTTIVTNACLGKYTCKVLAGNSLFGDPCSGTAKTLQWSFKCA